MGSLGILSGYFEERFGINTLYFKPGFSIKTYDILSSWFIVNLSLYVIMV